MWWKQAENGLRGFGYVERSGKRKKKKKSPSDYGKSRHHPCLITAAKKTTHAVVFLIQFHHLMSPAHSFPSYTFVPLPSPSETLPPLLVAEGWGGVGGWGGRAANLIKVIGMTDATRVIRSPGNYLQHRPGYTEQQCCGAFLQEPRGGGRKNLPPIKLSTRSPNKAICVGKRMHYSSFRRDSDGGTSPSEKRDSCPGLGGGDKREAGFHNLFCLVNNVPQNQ